MKKLIMIVTMLALCISMVCPAFAAESGFVPSITYKGVPEVVTVKDAPTTLVLTRQNLPQLAGSSLEALKGGYILEDSAKETPDAILIASVSEVSLAVDAKKALAEKGVDVRVVSMPCMDLFEAQSAEYKEAVLPKCVRKRVAIEALSDFGWGRYVGLDGAYVTMKGFGASGPAGELFKHFGFTVENVVAAVEGIL